MRLVCPDCGLRLDLSYRQPEVEHCPRCLGRRRQVVKMTSVSGAPGGRPRPDLVAAIARDVGRGGSGARR